MHDTLDIFRLANGLATHASQRHAEIARNVANADTPGYRARDVKPFAETYQAQTPPLKSTRTQHVGGTPARALTAEVVDASGASSPNGNSVSLEAEMVKAAEVKQSHDMALAVYQTSLGILRTSLGRGR